MLPCPTTQCNYDPDKPICQACRALQKIWNEKRERREDNRREYERLKKDPEYRDVHFNPVSGGVKATHVEHSDLTTDKKRYFGLSPNQLENICQDILYRLGNSAILCNENIKNVLGGNDTSLDLLLNKNRMDIASITQNKEHYMYPLARKNRQLGKYNHLEYVSKPADSVCLYFHDPSMYSPEKVLKGFEQLKLFTYEDKETGEIKHFHIRIKHIYCVINENEGRMETFDVD